jgi:hypothetical protein
VDLVIEFQTDEVIASAIASKYLEAKHSIHRNRYSASRRHLLRRQQLSGGAHCRTLPGTLGEAKLEGKQTKSCSLSCCGSLPKAQYGASADSAKRCTNPRAPFHRRRRPVPGVARKGPQHLRESKEKPGGGRGKRSQRPGIAAFEEAGRARLCDYRTNVEPEARRNCARSHATGSVGRISLKIRRRPVAAFDILTGGQSHRPSLPTIRSSRRTTSTTSTPTIAC